MARVIGIDLGTTYSVAAVMEGGRPVVIPNAEGGRLTPSVVAFTKDGNRLVGQLAKRQAVANPERTISSIKRHMGRRAFLGPDNLGADRIISQIKRRMGSDYRVKIDEREYTPEEISALILRKVKTDAESYLGGKIEKAVVTVPAYFNDSQRQATKDAGTIAGLDVIRIVSEPTAAALAYGLDKENIHTVLVWDLGGGTFDVSILELGEGFFQVKAVNGNTWLGGDDWTQRIADHLADEFQEKHGVDLRKDKGALQSLKEAAEKAKTELATAGTTNIRLPFIDAGKKSMKRLDTALTREKFEELAEDLLQKMVAPTQQALADAQFSPEDIDRVILVGGATRMAAVQELIRKLMGQEPYRDIDPDEVVGIGAAIQAGILTGEVRGAVLIDVTPLSLGIETMGGIFTKIIERNTSIPTSKGQIFTTAADNQTAVDIHVLQGERAMARDNMTLDRFCLSDIPPQPRGEPQIEVIFEIDANGIVHVSAQDLHTDNNKKIRVSSRFNGLPQQEIERLLKEAQLFAETDHRRKEEVEINIKADSMIAAAEHLIKESLGKVSTSLPDEVERGIFAVKAALAEASGPEVTAKTEGLRKLIEKLHREAKRIEQEEQRRQI
ncbi:MAG: molecular chaperone DnaK [Thermodesulfobacteriota bacterium]